MKRRHRWRPVRLFAAAVALAVAAVPTLGLGGTAQPARAAAVPWTCDAYGYLFQSPNGQNNKPHTVQRVDLTTGAYSQLGTTADALNGVGYNTLDNYFYAWDHNTSKIARVNADLTLTQMGLPAGFPNTDINIGDFDLAGHYFAANGNATPAPWREVDFAPGSPTFGQVIASGTLTRSAGINLPSDWSYIAGPAPVGFYGAGETTSGSGNAHLFRFDPADGSMTDLGAVPGLPSGSAYGASYADANGYVYVSNNSTGVIYRIDPATRTQLTVANGPKALNNDGARCLTVRTPTITVAKSVAGRIQPDDQFTVTLADAAGTPLTSATTSGTGTSATSPNWPVSVGSTYQLSESMTDTSPSPVTAYTATMECVDNTRGTRAAVGGAGPHWTVDVTNADDYVCTVTNTPNAQASISLAKTASPIDPGAFTVGQVITYSYVVTNTGNVPLSQITVAEDPGAFTGSGPPPVPDCPETMLAPGAQETCTATYTLTEQDVAAGSLSNTATATGTPPGGPPTVSPPSTVVIPSAPSPSLTVLKTAAPTAVTAAGQSVTYSYRVTNTGNVPLTSVHVVDDPALFTGGGTVSAVTCPATELAPATATVCTATYTATQEDIDRGGFQNTATAHGSDPTGADIASQPSTADVGATRTPALTLAKTVAPTTVTTAGSTVTYTFTITNTGNTTLRDVTAAETASNRHGALSAVTCPAEAASLAPQASVQCTATYTVTAEDLTLDALTNTATATGRAPDDSAVTSPPSSAVVGIGTAALTLAKTADPATVTAAGQTVTYTFTVTDTGTVPLDNVSISETAFSGTGTLSAVSCPNTSLASGASMTCTATYTVTAEDLAAGRIANTAVATATAPDGPTVTSPPAGAEVTATRPAPGTLELTKSGVLEGDQVLWTFTLHNGGGQDVTGITIEDPTAGTVTCPAAILAPGASMTCTAAPHTVTAADRTAGRVDNTATAHGVSDGRPVESGPAGASVPLPKPAPEPTHPPRPPHHHPHLPETGAPALAIGGLAVLLLTAGLMMARSRRRA